MPENALAVLGRTLADTADRASWENAHRDIIGSYRAASFARAESIETYVRQMLTPKRFRGSAATGSGVRWEPMLLAWAGADPNSLLIGHPTVAGFGATVDGTRPNGAHWRIVETKAKHNQVVTGPTAAELRQMAWQLYCIPEADAVDFVWGELVVDERVGWRLRRDPLTLTFRRHDDPIAATTARIVPIATEVLAAVREARKIEQAAA